MPLFHSLACSLQPTAHAQTQGGACTRTLRWMQTHTALAEGLEQFLLLWLFSSAVTLLPWHVIKKCHRFWRSDFRRALPQNGQKGRREGRVRNDDELARDHACKLNPGWGWGGGVTEPFLVTWWKQPVVSLCLFATSWFFVSVTHGQEIWTWPGAQSRLHRRVRVLRPKSLDQIRARRSFLRSPLFTSHHPFHFSQLVLGPFLFFSLALFLFLAPSFLSLSLQRQGDPCAQS